MKVFCCQLDTVWKDPSANLRKVASFLEKVKIPAGSLVHLPEMFTTGFCMESRQIAETELSNSVSVLMKCAAQFRCYIIAGVAVRESDGNDYNEAVVIGPDGVEIGRYQKLHLFSFAGEDKNYTAGHRIILFDTGEFRVCPLICYDLRFPETFRLAVSHGAQIFSVLANWPTVRQEHWITLLRARAMENQAYVVGTNRCGRDPFNDYPGMSTIVGPDGTVLAQGNGTESVVQAEINLTKLEDYRRNFPALRDRTDFSEVVLSSDSKMAGPI